MSVADVRAPDGSTYAELGARRELRLAANGFDRARLPRSSTARELRPSRPRCSRRDSIATRLHSHASAVRVPSDAAIPDMAWSAMTRMAFYKN